MSKGLSLAHTSFLTALINAPIMAWLMSSGFRLGSEVAFYNGTTMDGLIVSNLCQYGTFTCGGLVAVLFTRYIRKRKGAYRNLRTALQLLALLAWFFGTVTIGFILYTTRAEPFPPSSPEFVRDSVLTFVLMAAAGGFFFWGTLDLAFNDLRNPEMVKSAAAMVFLHAVVYPASTLVITAVTASIFGADANIVYTYRCLLLFILLMIVPWMFDDSPFGPEQYTARPRPTGWLTLTQHFLASLLFHFGFFLPFLRLPVEHLTVPGLGASTAIYTLLGGFFVGRAVSGAFFATKVERLADVMAVFALVCLTIVCAFWWEGVMDAGGVATIATFYGALAGYAEFWFLSKSISFEGLDQTDLMALHLLSMVPGPFFATLFYDNVYTLVFTFAFSALFALSSLVSGVYIKRA